MKLKKTIVQLQVYSCRKIILVVNVLVILITKDSCIHVNIVLDHHQINVCNVEMDIISTNKTHNNVNHVLKDANSVKTNNIVLFHNQDISYMNMKLSIQNMVL